MKEEIDTHSRLICSGVPAGHPQCPSPSTEEGSGWPKSPLAHAHAQVDKIVLLERISERICEQSGVVDVTKISSRDQKLQRAAEQRISQFMEESFEVDKVDPREDFFWKVCVLGASSWKRLHVGKGCAEVMVLWRCPFFPGLNREETSSRH